MEQLFENRYFAKHRMFSEFARKYSLGPRPAAVCIVIAIYTYFIVKSWLGGILLEMLPTLLFMGVVFGSLYFLPDYYSWLTLRNTKKQNDGELPETKIVFGDTIEMFEGMVHLTIEYRKIEKVVRLRNSYVLIYCTLLLKHILDDRICALNHGIHTALVSLKHMRVEFLHHILGLCSIEVRQIPHQFP